MCFMILNRSQLFSSKNRRKMQQLQRASKWHCLKFSAAVQAVGGVIDLILDWFLEESVFLQWKVWRCLHQGLVSTVRNLLAPLTAKNLLTFKLLDRLWMCFKSFVEEGWMWTVVFMSCLLMTHGAWIKVKCRSDDRKTAAAPPWATSRETRRRGDKSIDGPGLNRYMAFDWTSGHIGSELRTLYLFGWWSTRLSMGETGNGQMDSFFSLVVK